MREAPAQAQNAECQADYVPCGSGVRLMRITYLHQYFRTPAQFGGTRSFDLARRLVARGHDVTMIASDRTGRSSVQIQQWVDGVRVIWIPLAYDQSMSYRQRMAVFLRFALKSARVACQTPCDIVIASSTPLTIALPAMLASWRRRVPWVFEVRDLWPEIPLAVGAIRNPVIAWAAKALASAAYRSATAIVALSPGIRAGIIRYGVDGRKVTVIPNFCELDRFGRRVAPAGDWIGGHPELASRPLALYAGQVGHINGIEFVLDMARIAQHVMPDLAFVLLGRGSQWGMIEAQARQQGLLGRNVFMYPGVPKADVPSAFAAANVSLGIFRPGLGMESNSSNKFFDALASGCPVAINYGGWQAELVAHEGLGVVLTPNDASQAAKQLIAFMSDQPAIDHARASARRVARRDFDADVMATRLERVLAAAAGRRATDQMVNES